MAWQANENSFHGTSLLPCRHSRPPWVVRGERGRVDRSSRFDRVADGAGAANLDSGHPYLPGDANLDSTVDISGFNQWNANKFTSTAAGTPGDLTASGMVDACDFNVWNSNKFTASVSPAAHLVAPSRKTFLFIAILSASRGP